MGSIAPVRWFSFSDTSVAGSNEAMPITASVTMPTPASAHAHHRLRGAIGDSTLGTMSVVVSLTDLTTQAAWMAGLAIVALVLAGWRKNARATARTPRGEPMLRRPWEPVPIAETTTSLYKRPGLLRRVWAAVASTGIAVVIGAVSAIIIAFATGWLVITLTDLLKT